MQWWGKFILACLALATAFFGIFHGSVAAVSNFASKCVELVLRLDVGTRGVPGREAQANAMGLTKVPTLVPSETKAAEQFEFYIRDELSTGQVSETTKLYFGGSATPAGVFHLMDRHPSERLAVTAEGGVRRYQYRLDAQIVLQTGLGNLTLQCDGSGTIEVRPGRTFVVSSVYDPLTHTCIATLE